MMTLVLSAHSSCSTDCLTALPLPNPPSPPTHSFTHSLTLIGVAYMMTLVLSAPAVDPSTLAPKGTVLNAEKANDARAAVRVPFTRIIPTALKVRVCVCVSAVAYRWGCGGLTGSNASGCVRCTCGCS